MSINKLLSDDYEIIYEKQTTLKYSTNNSEEEYNILIQLCNNDFILINARREQISESFYQTQMNMDEFKNLNSKLLKFCETIQDIYNFLSDSFDDNKFIIKDIKPTKLKLETTVQISRSISYSFELILNKKKSETDDTVKMLCETITKLENEKEDLIQKINRIEKKINELSRMSEFYLDKFSLILHYQNISYKTPEFSKWKYTQNELKLNDSFNAIISTNMENNIIIFCGSRVPANSYYVNLEQLNKPSTVGFGNNTGFGFGSQTNQNNGIIYYNNQYLCPFFIKVNDTIQNSFVFCLYGKLKV
ncbi:hypothetical protein U3516DRAFT_900797 [Neocallimastix sp. 'constans']|jgi:DNA repair ATPase RecN